MSLEGVGALVPEREFDIYQNPSGYVAVTSPVRRSILKALAKGELEMTDLVGVTGKAKPTLSNVHLRELLDQQLIEERPHPADARRKLYRLVARHIGSSNVPLEQLRGAVKHYVSVSPLAYSIPFPAMLDALCTEGAAPDVVRAQARRLGESASSLFRAQGTRDIMTAVAAFWERERIARPAKLDFERRELELELLAAAPKARLELVGAALAGILEGVLRAHQSKTAIVEARLLRGKGARVAVRVATL